MSFRNLSQSYSRNATWLFYLSPVCALMMVSCGGSSDKCTIDLAISPRTATADHSATPPGNQVQFALSANVKGNCPEIPDSLGTWSTSDPANTDITSQGLATCLHQTSADVTISNSGTIRGRSFPSATLICK